MIKYNVIIIGAGPAGSFLAYKLKNQGLSILLLEKKGFPRYKTCAGGLSRKAYNLLFLENENIETIIEKRIKKVLYVRKQHFIARASEKELIYMIYRSDLDHFLLNMAVKNNTVCFKENISIQKIKTTKSNLTYVEEGRKQTIYYDILVGAWGSNIRLNKLVDLAPFKRFAVSSSWEGPVGPCFNKYFDEYALCQILRRYPGIIGYIFPKSELITAGLFTSQSSSFPVMKSMWKEFMEFWKLDNSIKPRNAIIPIRDSKKSIAKKNILLIGDAAGLADPFTGEGLYYAFISSLIASRHISNFFYNKKYNLAYEYTEEINSTLLDIQKWATVYEFLFHRFPNVSFWFGSECILGNEILNSFITGEIKYNEILKILKYSVKRILRRI
ncbi:hypothetical protein AYK25_09035 [Thermoplasmatales archaeon SM1-50]|nr:MAG: hypothetical protein AYK25_09035 [Thermoplasmatales archaeon SM1-50]